MKIFRSVICVFGIGFCIYSLWVNQLDVVMKSAITLCLAITMSSYLRDTWGKGN